jgi:hypothetical protein
LLTREALRAAYDDLGVARDRLYTRLDWALAVDDGDAVGYMLAELVEVHPGVARRLAGDDDDRGPRRRGSCPAPYRGDR